MSGQDFSRHFDNNLTESPVEMYRDVLIRPVVNPS